MNIVNLAGTLFWISKENKLPFPQTSIGINIEGEGLFVNINNVEPSDIGPKLEAYKNRPVALCDCIFDGSKSKDGRFFWCITAKRVLSLTEPTERSKCAFMGKCESIDGSTVLFSQRKQQREGKPPSYRYICTHGNSEFEIGSWYMIGGTVKQKADGCDHLHVVPRTIEKVGFIG